MSVNVFIIILFYCLRHQRSAYFKMIMSGEVSVVDKWGVTLLESKAD